MLIKGSYYVTQGLWWELLLRRRHISTEKLKSIAESEGGIWYLKKEPSFRISLPENAELNNLFGSYPTDFSPERPFVCEFRNCKLVGPYAVGLTKDDLIIGETTPVSLNKFRLTPSVYYRAPKRYLVPGVLGRILRPEPRNRLDCVFPLSCPDPSYYHWMMEYLPKIRFMEEYVDETGRVPKILVGPDPSGFVRDTLEFLGYEYVKSGRGITSAKRLVVSTHRTHLFDHSSPEKSNYNLSKEDIEWLKRRVRSTAGTDNETDGKERVYVSRQRTDRGRMLVNYDETMEILRKRGFESYVLEEMSFKQQVELFMNAEFVVGPHGAGLVNMVFADDPTMIELHLRGTVRPHFYFLSEIMGFDYESLIADNEDGNLLIDTSDLRSLLDSAGV